MNPSHVTTVECGTCDGSGRVPCPDSMCLGGDTYNGITGAKGYCRRCNGGGEIPCPNPECRDGEVEANDETDAEAAMVRGA